MNHQLIEEYHLTISDSTLKLIISIQSGMAEERPTKYLKQYTCCDINHWFQGQKQPKQHIEVRFVGRHGLANKQKELPTAIVDKIQNKEILYLLKWKYTENVILDLFVFHQNSFVRIQMNHKPILTNISGGHVYMVGTNRIYIINIANLNQSTQHNINPQETYYNIEPAYINHQIGAILYSWNQNIGFKYIKFTPNSKQDSSTWAIQLSNRFLCKKIIPNGFLTVVIPNVLGIVFVSNLEYCLINLDQMEIINKRRKLMEWYIQQPSNLRIEYRQAPKQQQYDDCLLIAIAQKNIIQIVKLKVVYSRQKKKLHGIDDDAISLISTLTNPYLIDWDDTQVEDLATFHLRGHLIDFIMLDSGIVYCCDQANVKIPKLQFIDYFNPYLKYPIIPLQQNIWNQYIMDQQNLKNKCPQFSDYNRLLTPNRYTLPFLRFSSNININKIQQINHKKIMIDWIKAFEIKKLVTYGSDILVVRNSAITTFLEISEQQFRYECQEVSCEKVARVDQQLSSQSINSGNRSQQKGIDKSFKEKKEDSYKQTQISGFIGEFLTKIVNPTEIPIYFNTIENKESVYAQLVMINRLKDIIIFTESYIRKHSSRQHLSSNPNSHQTDNEFEVFMYYLNFFSKLLREPQSQIKMFGIDAIHLYANRHKIEISKNQEANQTVVNIDRQCWKIIKQLFRDLIPSQHCSLNTMQKGINSFVKMLASDRKNLRNEKSELYQMFSGFYTQNIQQLYVSNTIFYVTLFAPVPQAQFQAIFNGFTLRIINYLKKNPQMKHHNNYLSFIDAIAKTWVLPKQFKLKLYKAVESYLSIIPIDDSLEQCETLFDVENNNEICDTHQQIDEKKIAVPLNFSNIPILEQYLKKISKEQNLEQFFMKNLGMHLAAGSSKRNPLEIEKFMYGWVLYCRVYLQKFNNLVSEIKTLEKKQSEEKLEIVSGRKIQYPEREKNRQQVLSYLKKSIKGLKNARYYQQMLFNALISDQQLLKLIGQRQILGKLVTIRWLSIIQSVLQDPTFDNYTDAKMVCCEYLDQLFAQAQDLKIDNEQVIDHLKELHTLFSLKQISRIIIKNDKLSQKYLKLKNNKIKAFLGYADVNTLNMNQKLDFIKSINFRNPCVEAQFIK